ncbi:MAG: hypothetical protein WCP57_04385 [Bacteroidota bacterium]
MKKIILFICILSASFISVAQNNDAVVWFGVDFTQARLIGYEGFTDVQKIKDYYFNEWNNVIVTESDKYNIGKYFQKQR